MKAERPRTDHASTAPAASNFRESLNALRTSVRFLKGVGPARAAQLETFGLRTIEDILYHLPFRYEDRRAVGNIRDASVGDETTFIGKLIAFSKHFNPRRRQRMLTAMLDDDTGRLGLVWYRAPSYLVDGLAKGQTLVIHGKVEAGPGGHKQIAHPEFEVIDPGDPPDHEKILPVYERPEGIALKTMRKWIAEAVETYAAHVPAFLPPAVMKKSGLLDARAALKRLHLPGKSDDVDALNQCASAAHRSVVFDEFFYLQLGLALRRQNRTGRSGIAFAREKKSLTQKMWEMLPFRLTRAQEKVLQEIALDMAAPRPMQ
ncbi:MAG TPA: OB-fold nucleic acid binding domain-containing protein, partial [Candidatus Binatia bacterium]